MDVLVEPAMSGERTEIGLVGRGIAPGLGMGKAWVVGDVLKCTGATQSISQDDVERELSRLNQSFAETLAELDKSSQRIEFEFDAALAGIFRAHGLMLRDLLSSGEFERELRTSLLTAETAVRRVFHRWYQKFEALEDQILRGRA